MDESRLVVRLFFVCSVLPSAFSHHFLGGNIMMRPKPGGAESEVNTLLQRVYTSFIICVL